MPEAYREFIPYVWAKKAKMVKQIEEVKE